MKSRFVNNLIFFAWTQHLNYLSHLSPFLPSKFFLQLDTSFSSNVHILPELKWLSHIFSQQLTRYFRFIIHLTCASPAAAVLFDSFPSQNLSFHFTEEGRVFRLHIWRVYFLHPATFLGLRLIILPYLLALLSSLLYFQCFFSEKSL